MPPRPERKREAPSSSRRRYPSYSSSKRARTDDGNGNGKGGEERHDAHGSSVPMETPNDGTVEKEKQAPPRTSDDIYENIVGSPPHDFGSDAEDTAVVTVPREPTDKPSEARRGAPRPEVSTKRQSSSSSNKGDERGTPSMTSTRKRAVSSISSSVNRSKGWVLS